MLKYYHNYELKLKLVVYKHYFTSMWRHRTIIDNQSDLSLIVNYS